MSKSIRITATVIASAFAGCAVAAVSADEAKQLGGATLTAFGAEKAGNKDGTIPAYSGEGIKSFAKVPGDANATPDPYGEKPLFSITAQNYSKYADKLDGQVEMFRKFPNYRMDVYPSHRDWVYPKTILEGTAKNAIECKGAKDELKLEGCYAGVPFPIPKTGKQVMWNHLLQYQATSWEGVTQSWVTPPNGVGSLQTLAFAHQESPAYFPDKVGKVLPSNVVYWRIIQEDQGPARKVGGKLIVIDSMDMVDVGRRVWQYIPGQRRVKLAPDLAYDTPSPNSGGASTMDDAKGFMGAMDRFDFKLVGKKEKYIMYDNFTLNDHTTCHDDKVVNNASFPHPDCVRWELHRVWVVEATLKPGYRHIYGKRKFYWDEDSQGSGSVENYDAAGKLYRMGFQLSYPWPSSIGGGSTDATYLHDLQTGIWAIQGSLGFKGSGWYPVKIRPETDFSPEALAGQGVR